MKKLIIVSNRLPVKASRRRDRLDFQTSSGGLATGLSSFFKSGQSQWLGWPGIAPRGPHEREMIINKLNAENMHPVFLTKHQIDLYYLGFSNKTIWPLFHYFPQYAQYKKTFWESYQTVNQIFTEEVLKVMDDDSIIWVNDYQLMLVPELIRNKYPEVTIGFFLHIPFPSYELFRTLPWRREILKGLLGSDLIGFHTYDYVRHFISATTRILGLDYSLMNITIDGRKVRADSFPMGIDYQKFNQAGDTPKVQKELKKILKIVGDRKILLSVDRLDYSKGIPQRLRAFHLFLNNYPEYREKITMIMVVVPSRSKVEHYHRLKEEVDELVGSINGRFGTIGWLPIWYLYRDLPFACVSALYNAADIALVTPYRDGMNLVAKEFVASKTDGKGVLILGEMAGAADELHDALVINSNDLDEMVVAIKKALDTEEKTQIWNMRRMQKILKRYNVHRWAQDFIENLENTKGQQKTLGEKKLRSETKAMIKQAYQSAENRLFLLDYDGTLMPIYKNPQDVIPDLKLRKIIQGLVKNPKNELVIVSGRNKLILENWLGDLGIGLVAEHGVWIRAVGQDWRIVESVSSEWKNKIRPILDLYTERTPGSFVEEKEFSLAWHFRKTDPELGKIRTIELVDRLMYLTEDLNLQVLEGKKVIEVKNTGVNKGHAIQHWLEKKNWEFILAAGDDWTDEDLFLSLPNHALSIKVGYQPTEAKYNCKSHLEIREILSSLL